MLKPYLLFAGPYSHPAGGINDYKGDFENLEAAIRHCAALECECDWAHVVLTKDMSIVAEASYLYSEAISIDWRIK